MNVVEEECEVMKWWSDEVMKWWKKYLDAVDNAAKDMIGMEDLDDILDMAEGTLDLSSSDSDDVSIRILTANTLFNDIATCFVSTAFIYCNNINYYYYYYYYYHC